MTFTIEDVKRLVPEARVSEFDEEDAYLGEDWPSNSIRSPIFQALFTTRRQLEIAMEALESISGAYQGDPWADDAIESIKKVGES